MPYSYTQLLGTGSITNFNFGFGYLSKAHISVSVDGAPASFTWLTDFSVQVTPAPGAGTIVEIRRVTPLDQPAIIWTDGSTLTEADMNMEARFNLYSAQEVLDSVSASIRQNALGAWDGLGREATNFADPTSPESLVTKGYFDTNYTPALDAKVAEATTQASNSAGSAAASAASAVASATSATDASNTLKDFVGQYYGPLASAPMVDPNGNPPTAGDLYFDTSAQEMRVYRSDGSWQPAGSTIEGILKRPPGGTPIVATAGQTVVPVIGGYDPGNVLVTINGLAVTSPEVDTTSGTDLVFSPTLNAGDEVDFYAFGAFQVADLRAEVVPFTPTGTIVSTNVQAALAALDAATVKKTGTAGAALLPEGADASRPTVGTIPTGAAAIRGNTQSGADYFIEALSRETNSWEALAFRSWVISKINTVAGVTYIYPSGGSAASPASIGVNERIVSANPFPGKVVFCQVEILFGGNWHVPGWYSTGAAGTEYAAGVQAHQLNDTIITQSGRNGVLLEGSLSGSTSPTPTDTPTKPFRVKVWTLNGVA